jgi:S1-C subfamily serine protease
MKNLLINTLCFVLSTFVVFDVNAGQITPKLIESLKPAVVSIKMCQTISAYGAPITGEGTGFVANKEKGIIITNRHIASVNTPSTYEATFYDGSTADLQLIWNDPTHDFAFLKINPEKIPPDVPQIKFSKTAKTGQDVFMIGNNQCLGHSVQQGTLNDLFSFILTDGKNQVLSISLNSRGGSSGSPVFNDDGQVVGLNFAANETTAFSVPVAYIQDALQNVLEKKTPARYATDAAFDTINLDHAQDYYQYKNSKMKQDLLNIPGSRNRLLQVSSLVSLPTQALEVGDIIEKVNETEIGPNQYLVEKELNGSEGKPVKFTVFRNGKLITLDVPTLNLNDALCSELLVFGNTIFAKVDYLMSFKTGMPIGSICIASKNPGSLFDELPQINVTGVAEIFPLAVVEKIFEKNIKTLKDVVNVLPDITKKKKFNYTIKDFGFFTNNNTFFTRQNAISLRAQYKPEQYAPPSLIQFDNEQHDWVRKEVIQ